MLLKYDSNQMYDIYKQKEIPCRFTVDEAVSEHLSKVSFLGLLVKK